MLFYSTLDWRKRSATQFVPMKVARKTELACVKEYFAGHVPTVRYRTSVRDKCHNSLQKTL